MALNPEAVDCLVRENYEIGTASSKLISSGDNEIYLITTEDGNYIFRISRPNKAWLKQQENVLFEMEWLTFLKEKGLPISYPIHKSNGEVVGTLETEEGARYWALLSFAPGENQMAPQLAEIYGRSLAKIHLASNEFTSNYPRHNIDLKFLLQDSVDRLEILMGGDYPLDFIYLRQLTKKLETQLNAIPFSGDEWGVIGGDFHGDNHHFTVDGKITHFDFDLCGYGWRAYDLAVFRWALDSDDDLIWEHFLEGYQSVRPLSRNELDAIPLFVTARQIWIMSIYAEHPELRGMLKRDWEEAMDELRYLDL